MARYLSVAFLGVLVPTWADGPEKAAVPKGPPPQFMMVSQVDPAKNSFSLLQMVEIPRTVQVVEEKVVDGQVVKVLKQVTEMVREIRELRMIGPTPPVYSAAGKKLAGDELWRRLKKGQVVLVAADGRMVDAAYLRVVQPDTLVVVPQASVPPLNGEKNPVPKKI